MNTTKATPITATELSRALSAHTPCCHYDGPGVTAAVVAVLKAHGYPVNGDVDAYALSHQERWEMAERLLKTAEELRTALRKFVPVKDLRIGDVVHESGETFEVTSQPHTVDGMLAVPTNEDQHPEVLWFPRTAQAVITTREA